MSGEMHPSCLEPYCDALEALAERYRSPDDGLKHRSDVRRRARDDPQDLARRRLLLQGLLRLGEQAHILDGDHGLVGERLQECDLGVRERLDLRPADSDYADRYILTQERYG